jgi:hypothetical protein
MIINKIIAPVVALLVAGASYLFPLPTAQGADIKSQRVKPAISSNWIAVEKEKKIVKNVEIESLPKKKDKIVIVFHDAPAQAAPVTQQPVYTPPPTPPTTTYANVSSVQAYAEQFMLSRYNWGSAQFSCLLPLWERESGWETTAANSSGAYGIPQADPGSMMASFGSDWRTDFKVQIAWGLSYIAGRYGNPCNALSHEYADGWY